VFRPPYADMVSASIIQHGEEVKAPYPVHSCLVRIIIFPCKTRSCLPGTIRRAA
jgi:hypothetical protein